MKKKKYQNGGIKGLLDKGKVRTEDMSEELKNDAKKMYGKDISPAMMAKVKAEYEDDEEYKPKKKSKFEKLKKKISNN